MADFDQIYKSINAVSRKVNSYAENIDIYYGVRAKENKELATEAQNALIEVDDSRLQAEADIENALIEIDGELSDIVDMLQEIANE